jgi:hypothetical protein
MLKAMLSKEYQSEASGDDYFLLRYAKKHGYSIEVLAKPNLAVCTNMPKTYTELLQQRIRWSKKSGRVVDAPAIITALIGLIYHLSFFALLFFYPFYIETIGLKLLIDLIIVTLYINRIKSLKNSIFFWFVTLIYPLHFIYLLCVIPFMKTTWKGRS